MNEARFWDLIERSRNGCCPVQRSFVTGRLRWTIDDDQSAKLVELLIDLETDEIIAFNHLFEEKLAQAYRWDIWAIAFIINEGCSNDNFMDFRAWLISRGKDFYENALQQPETIGDKVEQNEETLYESFWGAPQAVLDELQDEFDLPEAAEREGPQGTPWEEHDLPMRFPDLCKKFQFQARSTSGSLAHEMHPQFRFLERAWLDGVVAELLYGPWTEECTLFCRSHNVQHLVMESNYSSWKSMDMAFLKDIPFLRSLRIDSNRVVDLSPIKYATRLESLWCHLPNFRNVSQLSLALPLRELTLVSCKTLQSIDELSKLPHLKKLSLAKCGTIESLKPLSPSTTLEALALDETYVADDDLGCLLQIKSLEFFGFTPRKSYSHTREEWLQAKWGDELESWKARDEARRKEAWDNRPYPAVDPPEEKRIFYL